MPPASPRPEVPTDDALLRRIAGRDALAFETLMRRHNARLYRAARAILRDDAEAEDALQDAYLDAFRHVSDFRGEAAVRTWLTRIVVNRALMRLRRQKQDRVVVPFGAGRDGMTPEGEVPMHEPVDHAVEPPPTAVHRGEIRRLLERRIEQLPVTFRTVFVLRDVEDLSVEETAQCLSIPAATVRTRLFRARAILREGLARDLDLAAGEVFSGFAGARCDRVVTGVLRRLGSEV